MFYTRTIAFVAVDVQATSLFQRIDKPWTLYYFQLRFSCRQLRSVQLCTHHTLIYTEFAARRNLPFTF